MNEDDQIALLASDGMLVKRPLLVGNDLSCPALSRPSGKTLFVTCRGRCLHPPAELCGNRTTPGSLRTPTPTV